MLTKTKNQILIPRSEWDEMKTNPAFSDVLELLEDIADLEKARKVKGKTLSLDNYLKKRELQSRS